MGKTILNRGADLREYAKRANRLETLDELRPRFASQRSLTMQRASLRLGRARTQLGVRSQQRPRIDNVIFITQIVAHACGVRCRVNSLILEKAYDRLKKIISEPYPCMVGVRWRCVAPPWLFNLFIDSSLYYLKKFKYGLRIDELSIKCLLYANDQVILASSAWGLHVTVTKINDYDKKERSKPPSTPEGGMLRCFGHLERMNENRLRKQIYKANVCDGKIGKGFHRKSYADHIGDTLNVKHPKPCMIWISVKHEKYAKIVPGGNIETLSTHLGNRHQRVILCNRSQVRFKKPFRRGKSIGYPSSSLESYQQKRNKAIFLCTRIAPRIPAPED
ncbi:hypothetical protein EVAR_54547_1 [Eumeta japonica]|uniref:Reverse transcriptase domain-containing protein n=1 Tax=Eumeta variegata TaxID=151549 RepID=A0A4C1YR68_EUMVA|nr:hypothetical protein EVAR_54547_1 [Eumeta japonica]